MCLNILMHFPSARTRQPLNACASAAFAVIASLCQRARYIRLHFQSTVRLWNMGHCHVARINPCSHGVFAFAIDLDNQDLDVLYLVIMLRQLQYACSVISRELLPDNLVCVGIAVDLIPMRSTRVNRTRVVTLGAEMGAVKWMVPLLPSGVNIRWCWRCTFVLGRRFLAGALAGRHALS